MTKDEAAAFFTKLHQHWCRQGDACSSASAPTTCPALTVAPYCWPYVLVDVDGASACYTVDALLAGVPRSPEAPRPLDGTAPEPGLWWAELEDAAAALEVLMSMRRAPDAWAVEHLTPRN
jgi:hypothetical protein